MTSEAAKVGVVLSGGYGGPAADVQGGRCQGNGIGFCEVIWTTLLFYAAFEKA
jgi:hypothetical protein